jgi:peptidyl-dipeptidase Dcp
MKSLLVSLLVISPALAADNPLFEKSPLPYQLPQFKKITDADFRPAFEEGMARQLKEIEAIAEGPAAPTFDNTIAALEETGELLIRTSKTFFNLNSSDTNDDRQKIEAEMSPRLSAHSDAIFMNPRLFARVDELYQKRDALGLDVEQAQLLSRYHLLFLRAGAKLSESDKGRLKDVNKQIASLTTQFSQQLLKAAKDSAVVFGDAKELDGVSSEELGAASEAARMRKLDGKWLITLQNTTTQAVLENLKSRATREKIYRASIGRAQSGDVDNRPLVAKIVALRAQKARLLGFANFATYALEDEGAKTPAAVNNMLAGIGAGAGEDRSRGDPERHRPAGGGGWPQAIQPPALGLGFLRRPGSQGEVLI